jgi:hypothetical protein
MIDDWRLTIGIGIWNCDFEFGNWNFEFGKLDFGIWDL